MNSSMSICNDVNIRMKEGVLRDLPDLRGESLLRPRYAQFASRSFKETVVEDLRNRERLRHFRIFAHHVDHQLHAFVFYRHVSDDAAVELLEHLTREPPVVKLPLFHDDIDDLVAVARIETENESPQRRPHHRVNLIGILLNFLDQRAEPVLGKAQN